MPVYSFRCQKCDEPVEVEHSFREPHPTKHKGCGGKLTRIFHSPAIRYRGSGFYTTDKVLSDPPEDTE